MAMMMPVPSRKGRPEPPYRPPYRAWWGAALGAGTAALAALIGLALEQETPLGAAGNLLWVLLLGAVAVLLCAGLFALLLMLFQRIPPWLGAAVPGAIVALCAMMVLFGYPMEGIAFPLLLVLPPALVGGAAGLAWDRGQTRGVRVFGLVAAVLFAGTSWWLFSPGSGAPPAAPQPPAGQVAPLTAPNPADPGALEVRTLTYGSGTDRRRIEFGAKAAMTTEPVDGSALVNGWNWRRSWYWGFDPRKLPLNGRVWYPAGEGPYPLVLILHGNHPMGDYSDPGYEYLGKLLASRGYIVASIDENFLNMTTGGNLTKENAARAWLLLKHLETWQNWNATVGTPFYRRVDMADIGLIGHSRGGEAVYLAAALNNLPQFPDNAAVALGFRFHIRSVAALAPTDGQYKPSDKLLPLDGVSYLVLQGAADSDVSRFSGTRFYQRIHPGEGGFKAAVLIGGANHGQFNTAWGRYDLTGFGSRIVNVAPLMDGEAQRQVARVYLSAFLDATLKGNHSYQGLFQDYRAGSAWLPPTAYISQYEDGSMRLVSNYEEDADVLTTSAPGGAQRGENLKLWKEQGITLRGSESGLNTAAYLAWAPGAEGVPGYSLSLPENLLKEWQIGPGKALTFALADAREPKAGLPPLDLTVELVGADGTAVRLPLSRWAPVPVRTAPKLYKLGFIEPALFGRPAPVFQTYTLPLADFAAGAAFDLTQLRTVRLRFDRVGEGAVLLDDIGFRTLP